MAAIRILYLEDTGQTREAMVYILQKEGFDVCSYPTAEAAAPHLSRDDIDLAILDVGLPGRRGDDFGREYAEKHPHVRIYFLTAEAEVDQLKQLVPHCMVLRKPVDIDALLELLKCAPTAQRSATDDPPNPLAFPKSA